MLDALYFTAESCGPGDHFHTNTPGSVDDDGPDAFAFVHQVKRGVDIFQPHRVSDHVIDIDLAVEVIINVARQLAAALDATKRGASPDAAGDQLKRPRADFLPGS